MKKFILALTALLFMGHFFQLQFAWWSFAIPAVLTGAWTRFSPPRNFLLGFMALFIQWCGYALWIDIRNGGILSDRMGILFSVNPSFLPVISGLLAGILGGMATLTGGLGARLWA